MYSPHQGMPVPLLDGGQVVLARDAVGHMWIDGEPLVRLRLIAYEQAVALRTAQREVYLPRDVFDRWYFDEAG